MKPNFDDVHVVISVRLRLHNPFNEIAFDHASFHQFRNAPVETLQCLGSQFTALDTLLRSRTQVMINVKVGSSNSVDLIAHRMILFCLFFFKFQNSLKGVINIYFRIICSKFYRQC